MRPDAPASRLAGRLKAASGTHASVAACSTGTMAVIRGVQFIQDGDADLVLCGGADASLHPLWLAAFEQMDVLAPPHVDFGSGWACRPFDATRGGFALGEGAAVLVLESARSLKRTRSEPLARITGYARGTDPTGPTTLDETGASLAHVIRLACSRAGCRPDGLACIYAHGTGTQTNDRTEARAIRAVLADAAERVPIVSLKGVIGHLLGAAGAVELALAVLACKQGRSPGNLTLLEPDPALGRLQLPREEFPLAGGPILKTAMGFGGHVAAVVMAPV